MRRHVPIRSVFARSWEREGDICQYVEALVKMAGSEVKGLSNLRGVCDLCSKPPAPWEDMDCCALLSRQQHSGQSQESTSSSSWFGQQPRGPGEESSPLTSWLGGHEGPGKKHSGQSQESTSSSSWFGQQPSGPSQESSPLTSWLGAQGGHEGPGNNTPVRVRNPLRRVHGLASNQVVPVKNPRH